MRAVDVRVHRREAIGKTLGDKTLGGEVVALVKIVATDDMKNAGITFQTCGMQSDLVQEMRDPVSASLGGFQRDAANEAVNLVTPRQKLFRQIAAVLSGDSSDECFLLSHVAMPAIETAKGSEIVSKFRVDQLTPEMSNCDVGLLDSRGPYGRDDDRQIAKRCERVARSSGQRDGLTSQPSRGLRGLNDVRGCPTCAEGKQEIPLGWPELQPAEQKHLHKP